MAWLRATEVCSFHVLSGVILVGLWAYSRLIHLVPAGACSSLRSSPSPLSHVTDPTRQGVVSA